MSMSSDTKSKFANWNFLAFSVILLLALLIAGLHHFVESGFDPDILFTRTWWWGLLQKVAINLMVLSSTIWYRLSVLFSTDTALKQQISTVTTKVNTNVDPVTFDPFMVKYNRKRKIAQYKRNINKKLRKLEKKATEQDLKDWLEEDKPTTKYCMQKQDLLYKMSDEYIEKTIDNTDLKYNAISSQFVTGGYNRNNQKEEQYVESGFWKMVRDLSPRFVSTFVYLVAVNSIFITHVGTDDPLSAMLGFLLNIIAIIIQYTMGRGYATRYKDEKIMVDLRTRLEIIGIYLNETKGVEAHGK